MNEVYPKVKFLNWLKQLFGYEFPEPKHHNLSPQAFFDFYQKKLNSKWRAECKILVYRMDPAKAPFPSFMRLGGLLDIETLIAMIAPSGMVQTCEHALMPDIAWWEQSDMPKPWTAVFCIRLQRNWKTEYGSRTQEVCISTFEVNR